MLARHLCSTRAAVTKLARGKSSVAAVPSANAAFNLPSQAALARTPPYTPPERPNLGVGILAAETYFPRRFIDQTALEAADGVGAGKYTVGLGQTRLAFVDDREDINSICMNAVSNLLEKYDIDPRDVGRLDVGTESLVDKSKSTKTTVVGHCFGGNRDVEGATVLNACYGGTAALLNSAAWVESSEWDGRYAIFVAADIAVYEPGPARPTGGVGAVACLVGPDAPLRLKQQSRSSYTADQYDFYKPQMLSEYPAVDGRLSQQVYINAVDSCYRGTMTKLENGSGKTLTVDEVFDNVIFHSPYNKLVQQSYGRLIFNDVMRMVERGVPVPPHLAPLAEFASLPYEATISNRDIETILKEVGRDGYSKQVEPGVHYSKNIGNSYTGAVYANILSLLDSTGAALEGKNVGCFSYGSGAIATLFGLQGVRPTGDSSAFTLQRIRDTVQLSARLEARVEADFEDFTAAMNIREAAYGKNNYAPIGSLDNLEDGAWYLDGVDGDYHRSYRRKA